MVDKLGGKLWMIPFLEFVKITQEVMTTASTAGHLDHLDAPHILEPVYEQFFAQNPAAKNLL
jgi:hypothetical protein